jgi:hypothetical protein
MEWMVAIPYPQGPELALAGSGWKTQGGEQLAQHLVVVGLVPAQKGAHPDAVAAPAGETPTETVFHQAKFKAGGVGFLYRPFYFHGHGSGQAGVGVPHLQPGGQISLGAMGQHQGPAMHGF